MGYFDALASSSFKTTEDGQQIFYPWGVLSRGYIVPSAHEHERFHREIKLYLVSAFVFIIVVVASGGWIGGVLGAWIGGVIVLSIFFIPYVLWVRHRCRPLIQTNVKLTVSESYTDQARAQSTFILWLLEISSLVFVLAGFGMFLLDPSNWPIALSTIAFFGFCAVVIAKMLITKRRDSRSKFL